MKRRAFMNWVGVSLMATSLPVAIAACSPAENTTAEADPCAADTTAPAADSSAQSDEFVELGTISDLDSAGFLASKDFVAGPVIVIRDPNNADSIVALNSLCPHNGCHVDWTDTEFACPCHGSKFSTDGAVTNGPATEALGTYEAKVEGDRILVKAT